MRDLGEPSRKMLPVLCVSLTDGEWLCPKMDDSGIGMGLNRKECLNWLMMSAVGADRGHQGLLFPDKFPSKLQWHNDNGTRFVKMRNWDNLWGKRPSNLYRPIQMLVIIVRITLVRGCYFFNTWRQCLELQGGACLGQSRARWGAWVRMHSQRGTHMGLQ